jgi:hypothetical protein
MASKSAKAKKMSVSSKKTGSKKTGSKKTSAIHIALGGSNAAVCGARGRTTVLVDEVTCPECRKIAAHAAAKTRASTEEAAAAEAASGAPGNEAADAAEPTATPHERTPAATKASAGPATERDPRLPPPGAVIRKLDRHGAVRCECTVTADGVEYKGEIFKSLSGAAMAAAKDLNISGSQNGYLFFGLQKQVARAKNPVQVIEKAWDRYSARVKGISAANLDAGMKRALAELLESQGQKIVQAADAISQSE